MTLPGQLALEFCNGRSGDLAYLALCQVELDQDGNLPEWIPLVPKGDASGLVKSLDGREFKNSDPQAVIDAFNADPRDLPLDWEHATEKVRPEEGGKAPAAAWIDRLKLRDGGEIWGHIKEWTPKGAESVRTKEYRYISPAFLFAKATKVITDIISAGLVNRPALDMPAIARNTQTKPEPRAEEIMDREKLIKMLGLNADATDEDIVTAIEARGDDPTAKLEEMKTELDTASAKLTETETELANARKASPSLEQYVPRADYDAVVARAKKAEDAIATGAKDTRDKAVAAAIDEAMKAGKIAPASKDKYVAICATDEGFEQFKSLVDTLPKIGEPTGLDNKPPPSGGSGGGVDLSNVTDDDRKMAAQFGMSIEEFVRSRTETVEQQAAIARGEHVDNHAENSESN